MQDKQGIEQRIAARESGIIKQAMTIIETGLGRAGEALKSLRQVRDYLRLRIADRDHEIFARRAGPARWSVPMPAGSPPNDYDLGIVLADAFTPHVGTFHADLSSLDLDRLAP